MISREQRVAWLLFGLIVVGAIAAIVASESSRSGVASEGSAGDGGVAVDGDGGDGGNGADGSGDGDETATSSFTLAVSGDVLVHESVAQSAQTADGFDFGPQLALVEPLVSGADLAICHLEVPLSAENTDLAYFPAFRVPYQVADAVAGAGFDSCSLASNHALDAGPDGVAATIEHLDRVGVAHAGTATSAAGAEELTLLEVGEVTVGQLSYTYGLNGYDSLPADSAHLVDLIDEEAILDEAARLRDEGADFVLLSMHWGLEYQSALTDEQVQLAERLLPSPDVDLVVGHHAHVVQEIRRIGDEYAVFGLGNFLSNQSPQTCSECPQGTQDGAIVELTVSAGADGRWTVADIAYTPTWVDLDGHVVVVADTATPPAGVDPAALAASAQRTATALGPLATPRTPDSAPAAE